MKTIVDLKTLINKNTEEEIFKVAKERAENLQKEFNSFVSVCDYKKSEGESILKGIPYALKDNISTANILTTGSSKILKNYIPAYDATVYSKLKASGAVLLGKTVLDELAIGGTGTTAYTGVVKNPWDTKRISGGSSAGSATSVALGIVPFSIGSDTGDSVRKPAAFCGVVGFKPTYGLVSRYGLFAFAPSLDHIGCFTRTVEDAAIVTDIIKGQDEKDMNTLKDDGKDLVESLNMDLKDKKLFYIKEIANIKEYEDDEEKKNILQRFHKTIEKYRDMGITVEEVSISKDLLNALYPSYIAISCAEACGSNANLTGIHFGERSDKKQISEMIETARSEGFGEYIKRRFIIGSYVLQEKNKEKIFINAKRVRRMIVDTINGFFKDYDAMVLPSGGIAPHINEKSDKLSAKELLFENHLCIANFGAYPSISIPMGFYKDMPIGISITGAVKDDALVLALAHQLEDKLNFKGQVARGGKDV